MIKWISKTSSGLYWSNIVCFDQNKSDEGLASKSLHVKGKSVSSLSENSFSAHNQVFFWFCGSATHIDICWGGGGDSGKECSAQM